MTAGSSSGSASGSKHDALIDVRRKKKRKLDESSSPRTPQKPSSFSKVEKRPRDDAATLLKQKRKRDASSIDSIETSGDAAVQKQRLSETQKKVAKEKTVKPPLESTERSVSALLSQGFQTSRPIPPPAAPILASTSSSSAAAVGIDPSTLVKPLKTALRALISTLRELQQESELMEKVWYKNRSQFRSAYWFISFNAVRRTVKKTLVLGHSATTAAVRVYAGLWGESLPGGSEVCEVLGGMPGEVGREEGLVWPTIPKFATKPDKDHFRAFLHQQRAAETQATHPDPTSSPDAALDPCTVALVQLRTLDQAIRDLNARCVRAGKVFVKHLNTPPAPTFAPLVSALLAIVASVQHRVDLLMTTSTGQPGDISTTVRPEGPPQRKKGPLQTLIDTFELLSSAYSG